MLFCGTEIPGSLFKLARERMQRDATFTPQDIRNHLVKKAPEILQRISPIAANHQIIANRVMRDCVIACQMG